MAKSILLVVDVQNALINEQPFNKEAVVENIKNLISVARASNSEVVYVRHHDDELQLGSHNWQIFEEIAPKNDEQVFDKSFNSAFYETSLKEYLESKNIDTIVLVGLQTEYCIDATCKSAFDLGFKVIIPEHSNTTFDNEYLTGDKLYEFYNYKIWNNRFAKVQSIDDICKLLSHKSL